ncbi:4Fe-4S dicluster domain-containing protein [Ekhidna sp.]
MKYFENISSAIKSTSKGMMLSIQYFFQARKSRKKESVADDNYFEKANGTFTVQYPHEEIPIPDHGRYQLHNEIDDCIVCDKCAKICPVDCIDIEPIRSPEVFGKTSDGTPLRIHAAKFDIDMSKCCFCGLCTVVCPTECLTMTKEFDFSTTDILDHNFSFSKMTEVEIAEKKKEFDDYQAAKAQPSRDLPEIGGAKAQKPKPVMKTGVKPVIKPKPVVKAKQSGGTEEGSAIKPKIKPIVKPVIKPQTNSENKSTEAKKKPVVKPRIPKKK